MDRDRVSRENRKMSLQGRNKGNKGSTTIEVTLIMGILLLLTFLFIALMLAGLQQGVAHGELMEKNLITRTDQELSKQGISYEYEGNQRCMQENLDMELIRGYGIAGKVEVRMNRSNGQEQIRRWRTLGNFVE